VPDTQLLDYALRYASLGLHVFPLLKFRVDGRAVCVCRLGEKCGAAGKHPAVKWASQATSENERVRAWNWGRYGGIGCATGRSGLLVADADGERGVLELARLTGGGRLATARAKTARGWHVFFRAPVSGAPSSSDPTTKLDIRSTGGFVVLPPSPHASGHTYAWEVAPWDAAVAECPPALLEYALTRHTKKKQPGGMTGPQGTGVRRKSTSEQGVPPEEVTSDALRLPEYLACASPDFGARLARVLNAPDWAEVARALRAIPANCSMDEWVRVGMALHHASNGSLQGLDLWDKWSSFGGEKYNGRAETEYSWSRWQIREDGVGLGSLFDLAFRHGYKRQIIEAVSDPQAAAEGGQQAGITKEVEGSVESEPHVNGVTYELPPHITRAAPIWVDWSGGKNPKPMPTCRNVRVALRCIGIAASYNQLNHRMNVGGQMLGQWGGELSDNAVQALRSIIQREFDFDPPMTAMRDAAEQECLDHAFHPIINYFKTLRWDGHPRVDGWLTSYMSAENSPFNRAVARLWLVAGVRRILQPGCKFDQMPVFESPEGKGKSTALQILAGGSEYYSDTDILNASNQQQMELIAGKWIYEFGELTGIHGADVNKIKAFISRQVDRGRRAWGRYAVEQPRTGIFAGTTNDPAYLVSQTGNRRFWPVQCGAVDLDGVARDRDQLWAEAIVAERGTSLFLPESLWAAAAEAQEGSMLDHPWIELLQNEIGYEERKDDGTLEMRIATSDLIKAVGIKDGERQLWHSRQVMGCMIKIGWKFEKKPIKIKNKTCRGFSRPVTD
jgi:hypothetical protein